MQVAQTILEQLGGNRFCAMTGASNLVAGQNMLQFKIGRGAANKANLARVDLAADDTYTVKFYSVRGTSIRQISEHVAVYADALRRLFTQQTGMAVSL
jgi:AraC-like DNA-binding protein